MQIQVTRVTIKPKVFENSGDIAWGVQHADNQWYDLFQERKPEKGEVIECDVKVTEKNGRTYRNAHPKPSPKQVEKAKEVLKPVITATKLYPPPDEPKPFTQVNNIRTTSYTHPLSDYEKLINRGFELAGLNGVTDDAARVSLVAILCIAYGEGKLSIDDLSKQEWPTPERQKELDKELDGWGDRDWTDGPPTVEQSTNAAIDKEMAAARARVEKFIKAPITLPTGFSSVINDNTDYKTKLGVAIKEYCAKNKFDFQSSKLDVLWRCAETRSLESLSQEQAKIAIVQLGRLL